MIIASLKRVSTKLLKETEADQKRYAMNFVRFAALEILFLGVAAKDGTTYELSCLLH